MTIKARRVDTGTVEPNGTYVSVLPEKMSTSCSNACLTSTGASCTVATNATNSDSDKSCTSRAAKICCASSLLTTARTAGDGTGFGGIVVGVFTVVVVCCTVVVGSCRIVVVVEVGDVVVEVEEVDDPVVVGISGVAVVVVT